MSKEAVQVISTILAILFAGAVLLAYVFLFRKYRSHYADYIRSKNFDRRVEMWFFGVFPFDGNKLEHSSSKVDSRVLRRRALTSLVVLIVFVFGLVVISRLH